MTLPEDSAASAGGPAKPKIFLSYSRKDLAFVDKVDAALRACGFDPLIDRSDIYAFEDWWKRIQTLITKADTIVFVLSPDAISSDICAKEVDFAASLNKRFAPIVCRHVDDAVPQELRRLNFILFDDALRFDESIRRLVDALTIDIEWVRKHTDFGEQALRWAQAGRPGPRGLLLRSPVLEEAERWITSRPASAPAPTEATKAFIFQSRRAARQRRVQFVASTVAVAIIVGLGIAGWKNKSLLKAQLERLTEFFAPNIITLNKERQLRAMDTFKECASCPEMVVVAAGSFLAGDPPKGRHVFDSVQQGKVSITAPFAVSKFEVTFEEWDFCFVLGGCTYQPWDLLNWGRGKRPVINVSWNDIQQYVAWISKYTSKPYRLLSEAEWEYAARAGTETDYFWGDEIGTGKANCGTCGSRWDGKQTAPVGSFAANRFGLHDMHGNIREWVQDCFETTYDGPSNDGSAKISDGCFMRVVRGGSWNDNGRDLRSASRAGSVANDRSGNLGFRLARPLQP